MLPINLPPNSGLAHDLTLQYFCRTFLNTLRASIFYIFKVFNLRIA
jgi:hypothetical protein